VEKSRRLVDLATISVLLDAGAGKGYHYRGVDDDVLYRRSEVRLMHAHDSRIESRLLSEQLTVSCVCRLFCGVVRWCCSLIRVTSSSCSLAGFGHGDARHVQRRTVFVR
jgi:hypothetical protein